jgi:hypothetical protein
MQRKDQEDRRRKLVAGYWPAVNGAHLHGFDESTSIDYAIFAGLILPSSHVNTVGVAT